MTAGYAASSDARKRNAEKAAGYDVWRLARTCKPCTDDHSNECNGLAWDADEGRVIECLCKCPGDEKNITRGAE